MLMLYALLIYAVIGTIIAIFAKRKVSTDEDYYIGGRNVSGIVSALTYAATTYSAFMMVGLVGLTYLSGVGALGFELFYLVGTLLLLSYYAPKIWRMGKEKGLITPGDLVASRYGELTAKIMAIVVAIALIPYTSIQFVGISFLLGNAMSFEAGVVLSAIIIALWALLGGLRSVAWTDAVFGLFMLSMAIIAVFYAFSMFPSTPEFSKLGELMYVPNSFWTPLTFISFTLPWFFFALTNPQVLQRLFIPKDEKSLRRMVILFGVFGFIYTILVTLLGLILRLLEKEGIFPLVKNRDLVTPTFLNMIPEWLSIAIGLSIFAAAITTANSIVLTLSSMFSRDLLKNRSVLAGRLFVVAITSAVAIFAIQKPAYIVDLAVMSSTILLCQLPLFLGIFHYNIGGRISANVTLIAGFSTAIVMLYTKATFGIPVSVWVLLISFTAFFLTAILEKRFKVQN
ncbi:MAG: sodium:solute symporter family protein [Archaeoglobaceae archaeon]|nr:sodium:solute symporter family protein [Archaeoglobaceae archaeon]MDW8118259.1 sodium:solute symporter family protein [Archaeoglobaceae archaeon]